VKAPVGKFYPNMALLKKISFQETKMIESTIINLPKKMPLAMRISETGRQVRDWLQTVGKGFNDEKDKLQLTKWELKNDEFNYHYSLIKGKPLSASKVSMPDKESDLEIYDIPAID
jgi:hypothetical protein